MNKKTFELNAYEKGKFIQSSYFSEDGSNQYNLNKSYIFKKKIEQNIEKSSAKTSVFNLINSIIGSGILALPFVMMNLGIILGTIIIIIVYLMAIFSSKLLLKSKKISNESSYSKIGIKAFGVKGQYAILIIIIANNVGISINYIIIFGNFISKILDIVNTERNINSLLLSIVFWQIIGALLIFPFIFSKSTEHLKISSYFSLYFIVIFFSITMFNAINKYRKGILPNINFYPPNLKDFNVKNSISCFTTVFLAFTYHFNFFPIFNLLQKPSNKKIKKVYIIGLTIVLVIYIIIGLAGYSSYGSIVDENFLINFTVDDLGLFLYIILYLSICFLPLFSIPLFFFEARNNSLFLWNILFDKSANDYLLENNNQLIEENNKNQTMIDNISKDKKYKIFSICLYSFIVIIGITIKKFNILFEVIGATFGNAIAFILPSMFFLKLNLKKNLNKRLAEILLIIGLSSGCLTIFTEILKIFS